MRTAVEELAPEVVEQVKASMLARLEHVAEHIPEGDLQELILRSRPLPPFFEVTTTRRT